MSSDALSEGSSRLRGSSPASDAARSGNTHPRSDYGLVGSSPSMSTGFDSSTGNAEVYAKHLYHARQGTPLFGPDPRGLHYDRVRPGDIGWLKDGAFHRLFNLTLDPTNSLNDPRFRQEPRHLSNEIHRVVNERAPLSGGLMTSKSLRRFDGEYDGGVDFG